MKAIRPRAIRVVNSWLVNPNVYQQEVQGSTIEKSELVLNSRRLSSKGGESFHPRQSEIVTARCFLSLGNAGDSMRLSLLE